jgi:hypothetical protein
MGMKNGGLFFGVEPLLKYRPKHAALLAGISNAWAAVELGLAELFGYLVASRYSTARGGWSEDPMSNELWDSFVLIDHRLSLVRAAFNTRVNDEALKAEFDILASKVKKSSTSRSTFVHAAWAVSAAYPEHIIRTKMRAFDQKHDEPTSLKELWKVIEKIQRTAEALRDFDLKIHAYIASNLPAEPPPQPSGETVEFNFRFSVPVVFDPPLFDDSPLGE